MDGQDFSNIPVDRLRLGTMQPRDRIAPNFRLYELSLSDRAARRQIDNQIEDEEVLHSAVHLTRKVLQPIRDALGGFTPNCVYRSQALGRALKNKPASWISTSQHAEGHACEVEIAGKPTLEIAPWTRDHLDTFDQIVCECYDTRQGPNSGWVNSRCCGPGMERTARKC